MNMLLIVAKSIYRSSLAHSSLISLDEEGQRSKGEPMQMSLRLEIPLAHALFWLDELSLMKKSCNLTTKNAKTILWTIQVKWSTKNQTQFY